MLSVLCCIISSMSSCILCQSFAAWSTFYPIVKMKYVLRKHTCSEHRSKLPRSSTAAFAAQSNKTMFLRSRLGRVWCFHHCLVPSTQDPRPLAQQPYGLIFVAAMPGLIFVAVDLLFQMTM